MEVGVWTPSPLGSPDTGFRIVRSLGSSSHAHAPALERSGAW